MKSKMFDEVLGAQSQSPFHTPDWQWNIAESHFAHGMTIYRGTHTAFGQLFDYLKRLERNGEVLTSEQWPALAAAHAIYNCAGVIRDSLASKSVPHPYKFGSIGPKSCRSLLIEQRTRPHELPGPRFARKLCKDGQNYQS